MKYGITSLFAVLAWLLVSPPAQAQFIDCGVGGVDCTDTKYGLGNDPTIEPTSMVPTGIHSQNAGRPNAGRGGACGRANFGPLQGQIRIREQNNCVASATTRCPVEIPAIDNDSGFLAVTSNVFNLGAIGLVALAVGQFGDYQANIGHRQLSGTCGVSGDECALDSECDAQNAGDICTSTCFGSGDPCTSEDDAACPGLCRTEIEWDGIGVCTDNVTTCTVDADCPGEELCFDGFRANGNGDDTCICCQSQLGVICPTLPASNPLGEYPSITCAGFTPPFPNREGPDWQFDGGRETRWEFEVQNVAGQQEGVCGMNNQRSCGAIGDYVAGSENGKCADGTSECPDPVVGDPTMGAVPSPCDDVDFGGAAGDTCDFSEQSYRTVPQLNGDGTPDITKCGFGRRLVGTPGELCAMPVNVVNGDPQPGCQLANIGVHGVPDFDCNGIDDTVEGVCVPVGAPYCTEPEQCPPCAVDGDCASGNCLNTGTLCEFLAEENWHLDSNNDGIGNECQCGDGNGDGAVTSPDIAATALCANGVLGPFCDPTILDATGDNATTAEDIGGIVSVVNGVITTADLLCARNIDTGTP